jgi:hypothetical protein
LRAVDFSENFRNALEFALRLASQAEFNSLHCYEGIERQLLRTDKAPSEIMRYRRQFAKKVRREMKAFLDSVGRDQRSHRVPRILLGSVAKQVMRQVDSDVLVVRSGCTAIDIGSKTGRAA